MNRRLRDENFPFADGADSTPRVPQAAQPPKEPKVGPPAANPADSPKAQTKGNMPAGVDTTSDLLTVGEAAHYLRVSKSHLDKLRSAGGGPAYHRLGRRRVVYRRKELEDWVRARRYDFTAQYKDRP